MVDLTGPQPPNPEAGKDFEITAELGVPDYTFRWKIGDGEPDSVVQTDPTLKISIPAGTSGQGLVIYVKDGAGDDDSGAWTISLPGQEE
jgi:hypothetical protein